MISSFVVLAASSRLVVINTGSISKGPVLTLRCDSSFSAIPLVKISRDLFWTILCWTDCYRAPPVPVLSIFLLLKIALSMINGFRRSFVAVTGYHVDDGCTRCRLSRQAISTINGLGCWKCWQTNFTIIDGRRQTWLTIFWWQWIRERPDPQNWRPAGRPDVLPHLWPDAGPDRTVRSGRTYGRTITGPITGPRTGPKTGLSSDDGCNLTE